MSKTIEILPVKSLHGELTVPGDKSISHRAVIFGSIAEGKTIVEGFLEGADNLATIEAFRKMGVTIEKSPLSPPFEKGGMGGIIINGVGLNGLKEPDDIIDARNSGTTARLLTGLLSAQPFFSVITGDTSLRRRPMKRVVEPLTRMGANIRGRKHGEYLPLAIDGGKLKGIKYSLPMASAQVKSAILLAGLYAKGDTIIKEPLKSRDHTERMLKVFGAKVKSNGLTVTIQKTKRLNGLKIKVPGDISSAAFFMAAALITPESELLIKDVGINPTRCGIIEILKKMGGRVDVLNINGKDEPSGEDIKEPSADIAIRSSALFGIDISGEELIPAIDEFPILCVAAAFAKGKTIIRGAGELRVKESDRIKVMAESLKKIGVKVKELNDGIIINGTGGKPIKGGVIDSYGDHRIAMSMAIAALNSKKGVKINNSDCVDVSFPGFFEILKGCIK